MFFFLISFCKITNNPSIGSLTSIGESEGVGDKEYGTRNKHQVIGLRRLAGGGDGFPYPRVGLAMDAEGLGGGFQLVHREGARDRGLGEVPRK